MDVWLEVIGHSLEIIHMDDELKRLVKILSEHLGEQIKKEQDKSRTGEASS